MSKEYRIVGDRGMWGEVWPEFWFERFLDDFDYAKKAHPTHTFHVEEREVGEWRPIREMNICSAHMHLDDGGEDCKACHTGVWTPVEATEEETREALQKIFPNLG